MGKKLAGWPGPENGGVKKVVLYWYRLPRKVVASTFLEVFKRHVDMSFGDVI